MSNASFPASPTLAEYTNRDFVRQSSAAYRDTAGGSRGSSAFDETAAKNGYLLNRIRLLEAQNNLLSGQLKHLKRENETIAHYCEEIARFLEALCEEAQK